MKILVILAHPHPGSFNHALAGTVQKILKKLKHTIIFHDLYAENFPPLLPADEIPRDGKCEPVIDTHCKELTEADGIVIIHPNWWGMPPAVLKGWIDRVLRPGIAYEFAEDDPGFGIPIGLLHAKTAIVLNTSDTNKDREENIFLDPLETLWKNCIFYLCGIKIFYRKMFRIMVNSDQEQREEWLSETERIIVKFFG